MEVVNLDRLNGLVPLLPRDRTTQCAFEMGAWEEMGKNDTKADCSHMDSRPKEGFEFGMLVRFASAIIFWFCYSGRKFLLGILWYSFLRKMHDPVLVIVR